MQGHLTRAVTSRHASEKDEQLTRSLTRLLRANLQAKLRILKYLMSMCTLNMAWARFSHSFQALA